ncbi:MAG: hypothetical protein IKS61_00190 [Aeriscardovia sp.]|nr:hypothetical protein [Aeriscardovia sp.]
MQLRVGTADLKDAIAWAREALAQIPKDEGKIKLETGGNELKVKAVGRDRAASYHIEARIDEEGSAIVWAELAFKGIQALSSEYCSVETEGNAVHISAGGFRLQLTEVEGEVEFPPLLLTSGPADEIPAFPEGEEARRLGIQGSISPSDLASAVQRSVFAAGKGADSGPEFSSVKMEFKESEIVFTATNRYRMARCAVGWTPFGDYRGSVLVEAAALKSISNSFKSLPESESVRIGFNPEDPSIMSFESAGKVKTVQLTDPSAFPQTERLFKDEYDVNIILDRDEFLSVFRRVASVTEGDEAVHVDVSPAKCVISAKNAKAAASETMGAALIGRAVELDFGPAPLMEGLSLIRFSCIRMRTNEDLRIVEFDGQEGRDGQPDLSYRYLITPITL